MLGIKTFIVSVLLWNGALLLAAEPDYFPLAVGNSWTYKVTEGRVGGVGTVEVLGATAVDGRGYFRVSFFGRDVLLRTAADGTLLEYDAEAKREKVWIAFGSEVGTSFATEMDNCDKSAKVESKASKFSGPIGSFANGLQVSFVPSCADAGILSQTYLPYIGLVEHVVGNIAGARKFTLTYSRTGVTEVTTSELRFSLALDAAVYPVDASTPAQMIARLTLRNTTANPVSLQFPSGQSYDLKIRNEKGDVVYTWSADRGFIQVFRTELFGPGERNYVIEVPLPNLPKGKYVAEAYLTTAPQVFTATAGFEYR